MGGGGLADAEHVVCRACLENGLAVFFQSSGHCLRRVYITECHVMVTER